MGRRRDEFAWQVVCLFGCWVRLLAAGYLMVMLGRSLHCMGREELVVCTIMVVTGFYRSFHSSTLAFRGFLLPTISDGSELNRKPHTEYSSFTCP